jgi:hypothetical protein
VPDGLSASSRGPAEQQIHHIRGARYLVVDQTANRRHDSKASKDLVIWGGAEARPAGLLGALNIVYPIPMVARCGGDVADSSHHESHIVSNRILSNPLQY